MIYKATLNIAKRSWSGSRNWEGSWAWSWSEDWTESESESHDGGFNESWSGGRIRSMRMSMSGK